MNTLRVLLTRPLASRVTAAKVAQAICYVVAVGIFVLAILKLTALSLNEKELFFGLLLVLALFSSMICGGTLVRIEAELRRRNEPNQGD